MSLRYQTAGCDSPYFFLPERPSCSVKRQFVDRKRHRLAAGAVDCFPCQAGPALSVLHFVHIQAAQIIQANGLCADLFEHLDKSMKNVPGKRIEKVHSVGIPKQFTLFQYVPAADRDIRAGSRTPGSRLGNFFVQFDSDSFTAESLLIQISQYAPFSAAHVDENILRPQRHGTEYLFQAAVIRALCSIGPQFSVTGRFLPVCRYTAVASVSAHRRQAIPLMQLKKKS